MKKLKKNELFNQLQTFLDKQGIVLKKGTVTEGLRKGCHVLTDTINLAQHSVERAQNQMEDRVDSVRQAIHDHTAPHSATKGKTKTQPKSKTQSSGEKSGRSKSKQASKKATGKKSSRTRTGSSRKQTES